jgi:lipoyl(octanoyl) transferase
MGAEVAAREILRAEWVGRTPYDVALAIQREAVRERVERRAPHRLILLEHDDVITLGRGSGAGHVLIGDDEARRRGIVITESDRGGDVTYHGPGQLVGYPIIDLAALGDGRRDLHRYLRDIERALIAALGELGVTASTCAGRTGVWVGDEKVASIGVRVSHWITSHGFALNVATDLDRFRWIVPCGIDGCRMTSVARLTGTAPTLVAVGEVVARAFAERFDLELEWQTS